MWLQVRVPETSEAGVSVQADQARCPLLQNRRGQADLRRRVPRDQAKGEELVAPDIVHPEPNLIQARSMNISISDWLSKDPCDSVTMVGTVF